jgi:hypothetical protein
MALDWKKVTLIVTSIALLCATIVVLAWRGVLPAESVSVAVTGLVSLVTGWIAGLFTPTPIRAPAPALPPKDGAP